MLPWACAWLWKAGPAWWRWGSTMCSGATSPAPRTARAILSTPSTISITATASSSDRPTRGVTVQRRTMMAAPTAPRVRVWPTPQNAPTRAPAPNRRVRLTMVATATM